MAQNRHAAHRSFSADHLENHQLGRNTARKMRAARSAQRQMRRQQRLLMARQQRQQQLQRRLNAFRRAGAAFRTWWLQLLGVLIHVVRPIRAAAATTSLAEFSLLSRGLASPGHFPVHLKSQRGRKKSAATGHRSTEVLEIRTLLTGQTLQATLVDGTLTVDDVSAAPQDNDLIVETVNGGSDLQITDATEQFLSAPAGTILSADGRTLTVPVSLLTDAIIIRTGDGDDSIEIGEIGQPFSGSVTIDGQDGADTMRVEGVLETNGGGLIVAADNVEVLADISTSGGDVILSATNDILILANIQTAGGSYDVTADDLRVQGNIFNSSGPHFLDVSGNTTLGSGSDLRLQIGGPSPGQSIGDHSQIRSQGTVDIEAGIQLRIFSAAGFIPEPGTTVTIVERIGGVGTFSGLPEGAAVAENFLGSGRTAWITYEGGTGNDIVIHVAELQSLNMTPFVLEGNVASLDGSFVAAEPISTQELLIDWGDGTTSEVAMEPTIQSLQLLAVSDRDGVDSNLDGTFDSLDPENDFDLNVRIYSDRDERAAIEFDLQTIPSTYTVDAAVLKFVGFGIAGSPQVEIEIHGYDADGEVTLEDLAITNLIAGPISGTSSEIQSQMSAIDVSAFIQQLVAAGATHAGFGVRQIQQGGGLILTSFMDRISLNLNLTRPSAGFSAQHTYTDDGPSGTSSNSYVVTVRDKDTNQILGVTNTVVANASPVLTSVAATSVINENDVVTLTGTFSDQGTEDTHTVIIDWGEGSPQSVALPPGSREFSVTHRYLDDSTLANAEEVFPISIELMDDDSDSAVGSTSTLVRNINPVISGLQLDETVLSNGTATLTGTILDPGTLDSFTLEINWGDPASANNVETIVLGPAPSGTQQFTLTHQYVTSGVAQVALTITDKDGGVGTSNGSITVLGESAPSDILLSHSSVFENSLAGTVVGTLSAVDSNAGDQHVFELTDDYQGWFEIHGNELRLSTLAAPDFEISETLSVTVRATDLTGLSFEKQLTISIIDLPEDASDVTIAGFRLFNVSYSNGGTSIEGDANLPLSGVIHLSGTVLNGSEYDLTGNIGGLSIAGRTLSDAVFRLTNDELSLTANADFPFAGTVPVTGVVVDGNTFQLSTPPLNLAIGGFSLNDAVLTLSSNELALTAQADLPVVGTVSLEGSITNEAQYRFDASLPTLSVGGVSLTGITVSLDENGLSLEADGDIPIVGNVQLNGAIQDADNFSFSTPLFDLGVGDFSLQNTEIVLSPAGVTANGELNVPVFDAIDMSGTINTDGTFAITATPAPISLLSGLVSFDNIVLTLTEQAITVEADATVAEIGFASFEGSLFADGSYLLEAEVGIELAGFEIDGVLLTLGTEQHQECN